MGQIRNRTDYNKTTVSIGVCLLAVVLIKKMHYFIFLISDDNYLCRIPYSDSYTLEIQDRIFIKKVFHHLTYSAQFMRFFRLYVLRLGFD